MPRTSDIRKINGVAFHRNGVAGDPFYVVRFVSRDDEGNDRRMVGIVFDTPGSCAVLDADLLHDGEIGFGINSWRGDVFEPELRAAIQAWNNER